MANNFGYSCIDNMAVVIYENSVSFVIITAVQKNCVSFNIGEVNYILLKNIFQK